jgi:tetratricopeptide (TPR) repeat protein
MISPRPLFLLCLAAILASTSCAHIASTGSLESFPTITGESPEACYIEAIKLLDSGKDFDHAIALLRVSVKDSPNNPSYHLALGCAYADRAASVGHAFEYAQRHVQDIALYHDRVKAYHEGAFPASEKPFLVPPPAFSPYTKDDSKPFNLAQDQVVKQMVALGAEAMQEWRDGVQLSSNAGARAHAEYVQGYGLEILSEYQKLKAPNDQTDAYTTTLQGYPSGSDAIASLQAAVRDAPKDALYWEALGAVQEDADFQSPEGIANLRKSLAMQPRKSNLWYVFFDSEGWRERIRKVADVTHAVAEDPNNALPWYLLAYVDTEQTPLIQDGVNSSDIPDIRKAHPSWSLQECRLYVDRQMAKQLTAQDRNLFHRAIAALEEGNGKPKLYWPEYHPPVPAMLLPARRYSGDFGGVLPMAAIRETARAVVGIVDVSLIEGHRALAEREAQDIIDMGQRIISATPESRKPKPIDQLFYHALGQSIESLGREAALSAAIVSGDKAAIPSAQTAYDNSRQKMQVLNQQVIQMPEYSFLYNDY